MQQSMDDLGRDYGALDAMLDELADNSVHTSQLGDTFFNAYPEGGLFQGALSIAAPTAVCSYEIVNVVTRVGWI
eukprot:SAG31_NODE_1419_length_8430_cov_2.658024_6_plen_74_part_00